MDRILENDQQEQQEEAFARRFGLPRRTYRRTIRDAVAFTATAPPDPAARPWRPWGARNLSGRIRGLAQHPDTPSVLYAGVALGGLFRSDDDGATWQAVGQ